MVAAAHASLWNGVAEGDGSGLLAIADTLNSRNPDGTYQDNSTDAINAINNLDYTPERKHQPVGRAGPRPSRVNCRSSQVCGLPVRQVLSVADEAR